MSELHSIPEVPTSEKFAKAMRLIGNDFFYMEGAINSLEWWFGQIEDERMQETLERQVRAIGLMLEPHDPVTGELRMVDVFHYSNVKDGLLTGVRVADAVYGDAVDMSTILEAVVSAHEELGRHPAMKKGVKESLRAMGLRGLMELEPTQLAKVMSWERGANREFTAMYEESPGKPRRSDSFGIGFGIALLASMTQFDHNRLDSILAVGQQEMEQAAQDAKTYDWDGEFPEADPDSRG